MSDNLTQNLLPSVKEMEISSSKIKSPDALNFSFENGSRKDIQETIIELFSKKLPQINIAENGIPVLFAIDRKKLDKGDGEGYILSLNKDKIEITANGQSGLYYGALTLSQILEGSDELFELTITDWPSIKMRMFHLDLKSIPLEYEYLKHIITELSEHKINSVLIEYEDKFPFKEHLDIQVDSAMTPEQIQELSLLCKSKCVEIIPLVQSYAHLQYILIKEKYKHLREDPTSVHETCGTNPEAKELIFSMFEEVIAAHPDLKYFHIGGDEPFGARSCPECQKVIDKEGKGGLYLQHIKPIVEFIQQKGIVPIIWDDMLITHPEISDKLPKPLIINYWQYHSCTNTTDKVLVRGIRQLSLKDALQHPDTAKIDLY